MSFGDPEEVVKTFFEASVYNTLDSFDFDEAFNELGGYIYQKLAGHGLLSLEDFIEEEETINGNNSESLESFTVDTDYVYISSDEIYNVVMEYKYKKFREEFADKEAFKNLLKIHEDISTYSGNTVTENVLLMDRVIHAQHVTGDVFEDYFNPDDIRADVEREYKEMMNGEI